MSITQKEIAPRSLEERLRGEKDVPSDPSECPCH